MYQKEIFIPLVLHLSLYILRCYWQSITFYWIVWVLWPSANNFILQTACMSLLLCLYCCKERKHLSLFEVKWSVSPHIIFKSVNQIILLRNNGGTFYYLEFVFHKCLLAQIDYLLLHTVWRCRLNFCITILGLNMAYAADTM